MTIFPYNTWEQAILQANSNTYELLKSKIGLSDATENFEKNLRQVVLAAQFAGTFHTGRFADGSIENPTLDIGRRLIVKNSQQRSYTDKAVGKNHARHVLHITSLVDRVGGHTRMLYHWIRNDISSCHSVVLLNQHNSVPRWFSDVVLNGGGSLIKLSLIDTLCRKACDLAALVKKNVDLVVLHHSGSDVIPTIAFSNNDSPPVAVLNHADHVFWLGSSVTDMVINLRTAAAEHTSRRRFVSTNTVLPIPLVDSPRRISRRNARTSLGISQKEIVLLSVGRGEKYRPSGVFDFVATAAKILNQEKNAHLYVVGESRENINHFLRSEIHERLHFVGTVDDPSPYHHAADIYLESFPFGSTTALLEAALSGLPVVPAYAPLFPLLVGSADSIIGILTNPKNEQEYIERTMFLIDQPEQRGQLGQTLRRQILADHVGEGWLNRLDRLYVNTDRLSHSPGPIPESSCVFAPEDIGLCMWNVFSDGQTSYRDGAVDENTALLLHSGRAAKSVGNHAKAREFALRALWETPYRIATWRFFGAAIAGDKAPVIRKVLHNLKKKQAGVFL